MIGFQIFKVDHINVDVIRFKTSHSVKLECPLRKIDVKYQTSSIRIFQSQ